MSGPQQPFFPFVRPTPARPYSPNLWRPNWAAGPPRTMAPFLVQRPQPARPGGGVASAVQPCPLAHPCDVRLLQVRADGRIRGAAESKTAQVTSKLAPQIPPGSAVPELHRRYDFVIDVVAGYNVGGRVAHPGFITANTTVSPVPCPIHRHASIAFHFVGGPSAGPFIRAGHSAADLPNVASPSIDILDNPGRNHGPLQLFAFIGSFMQIRTSTDVEVIADSCGARPRGEAGRPNRQLLMLVRAFRDDKWSIGVNIPPLGQFRDRFARSATPRGAVPGDPRATDRTRERSWRFGTAQSGTTRVQTTGENLRQVHVTQTDERMGRRTQVETTRTRRDGRSSSSVRQTSTDEAGTVHNNNIEGRPAFEVINERLQRANGFELIIRRNDQEVNLGETVTRIREGIRALGEAVSAVRNFIRRLPQVGWSFDFQVFAFAGTVQLELEPYRVADRPRHYPIHHLVRFAIEMTIVKLELQVAFGIDAELWGTGVVLQARGRMGLEVKVKTPEPLVLSTQTSRPVALRLEITAPFSLSIVAEANFLGTTVAGGSFSVQSALEFPDGRFEVNPRTGHVGVTGTIWLKQVTYSGSLTLPVWGRTDIGPDELISRRPVFSF
jgi:hypothetical protein